MFCGALQLFDAVIRVVKTQGEAQKAAMEDAMACFETLDEALGKVSGCKSPRPFTLITH